MPEDIKAKFHAILDIVEHYASKFDAIQSPIDEYQEQEAKINGRIDQLRVEIDSAPLIGSRWCSGIAGFGSFPGEYCSGTKSNCTAT
ncbi:hypothetical protein CEP52_017837, partial [Fusarium oligoseptatum]